MVLVAAVMVSFREEFRAGGFKLTLSQESEPSSNGQPNGSVPHGSTNGPATNGTTTTTTTKVNGTETPGKSKTVGHQSILAKNTDQKH